MPTMVVLRVLTICEWLGDGITNVGLWAKHRLAVNSLLGDDDDNEDPNDALAYRACEEMSRVRYKGYALWGHQETAVFRDGEIAHMMTVIVPAEEHATTLAFHVDDTLLVEDAIDWLIENEKRRLGDDIRLG
jgi:hypothetical protein